VNIKGPRTVPEKRGLRKIFSASGSPCIVEKKELRLRGKLGKGTIKGREETVLLFKRRGKL